MRGERGQATVELVAVLPLVAVVALLAWQAVVAGHVVWLSGTAARAAARAEAVGGDPEAAARRLLSRAEVEIDEDGAVTLRTPVPAVVAGIDLAHVRTRARFAPQDG